MKNSLVAISLLVVGSFLSSTLHAANQPRGDGRCYPSPTSHDAICHSPYITHPSLPECDNWTQDGSCGMEQGVSGTQGGNKLKAERIRNRLAPDQNPRPGATFEYESVNPNLSRE